MIVYSGCLLFTFFSSFWNKWSFIYLFLLKKFNSPSSICTTGDWTAFLKVDMSLTHVLSFQPFSLICKIMYVIHLQADAKDALLATGLCPILILLWLFSCSRCVIFLFKRWKKNWQCVKVIWRTVCPSYYESMMCNVWHDAHNFLVECSLLHINKIFWSRLFWVFESIVSTWI